MKRTVRQEFSALCRELYGKPEWLNQPVAAISESQIAKDIDVLRGLATFTRSRVWKAMRETVRGSK